MMSTKEIDLTQPYKGTTKLRELDVELDDVKYVMRELDGEAREDYVNFTISRNKVNAEGRSVGVRDVKGMHARLLSMSLWKDGVKVEEALIQKWPSRTQKDLFDIAKKLSALDFGKEEQDEGNG